MFYLKQSDFTGNTVSAPFDYHRAGFSKALRLEVMHQFHNAFHRFPIDGKDRVTYLESSLLSRTFRRYCFNDQCMIGVFFWI